MDDTCAFVSTLEKSQFSITGTTSSQPANHLYTKTPTKDALSFWPPLPLIIYEPCTNGILVLNNIITTLEHNDVSNSTWVSFILGLFMQNCITTTITCLVLHSMSGITEYTLICLSSHQSLPPSLHANQSFKCRKTHRKLQEVFNNVFDFLCPKNLNLKIKNFPKEKKNFNEKVKVFLFQYLWLEYSDKNIWVFHMNKKL